MHPYIIGILFCALTVIYAIDNCVPSTDSTGCTPQDSGSYVDFYSNGQFWIATDSGYIETISVFLVQNSPPGGQLISLKLYTETYAAESTSASAIWGSNGIYTFSFPDIPYTTGDNMYFYLEQGSDIYAAISPDDYCLGMEAPFEAKRTSKREGADIYWAMGTVCSSGTSGDPHFFGFQGQKYDVMGQSFEIYNIITAPYLQINSRFIPYYKTATQIEPTGTMMGDLGYQFNGNRFYINSNSSIGLLNGQPVSLGANWELTFGNVVLSNKIKGRMYEITLASPDIVITFTRKVYKVTGLEDQWHFDYHARTLSHNEEFHG